MAETAREPIGTVQSINYIGSEAALTTNDIRFANVAEWWQPPMGILMVF